MSQLPSVGRGRPPSLDTVVGRFNQLWLDGARPVLDDYLVNLDADCRLAVLAELVHVELEFRLKAGERVRVEEYLKRYPELDRPDVLHSLVVAEYRLRQRREPGLTAGEYGERFPRHAQELSKRLDATIPTGLGMPPTVVNGRRPAGPLPERFGRYRILKRLGQGGMGTVYLAHDSQLDRSVAVKVPHFRPEDGTHILERFVIEARAAATLDHRNICPVHDAGQIDGIHYLTMAYIEGRPLSDLLRMERPFSPSEAAAVVRKLALALHEAHARGVIHRDLKPSNVLIDKDNEPVLMDFGLARRTGATEARLTHSGLVMGTPAYMSPEQANGNAKTLGPATDIYSLGVILYELLTGRLPFTGPAATVLGQIMSATPQPPSAYRPDLDPALEAICLQAMAKNIADRYPSMAALADDLSAYLQEGRQDQIQQSSTAQMSSSDRQTRIADADQPAALALSFWRRRPAQVTAAAALLLAALGLTAWTVITINTPVPHPPQVEPPLSPDSPLDALRRDRIPAEELAAVGGGDPQKAPAELVAILGNSRLKHWEAVSCVAFAPGGKILASGSWDHTVKLWEFPTGKEIRTLTGPEGRVLSLAYSDDGQIIAAGGARGTVTLWDAATGKLLRTLSKLPGPVLSVCFGNKVKVLAASGGNEVKVWQTATGKELHSFPSTPGHPALHQAVTFSPDGKVLAHTDREGRVKLRDVETGRELHPLVKCKRGTLALAFSPDGKTLASGNMNATITLWEAKTGKELRTFVAHGSHVLSLAFCPDCKTLVSGSQDGRVRLWDPTTGKRLANLAENEWAVHNLAISPDGKVVAFAAHSVYGFGDRVRFVSTNLQDPLLPVLEGHQSQIFSLTFCGKGQMLAAGDRKDHAAGTIRLWDTLQGHELKTFTQIGWVFSLACSPDGRWLASGFLDQGLKRWNIETGQEIRFQRSPTREVFAVALSKDGRLLASGAADGIIRLWDPDTGRELRHLTGHQEAINSLTFRTDSRLLASASNDRTIRLWETATGKTLITLSGHEHGVRSVVFSPRDGLLASSSYDGSIKLWDVSAGREVRTLRGHKGAVYSVAFSADEKWLASCGSDGTIRLWNPSTGEEKKMLQLGPPGGRICNIVFAPDGRHLATANGNGTVYILRLCGTEAR